MPDLQIIQIFLVITRPLPTLPKFQKMAKSRKLITLAITRTSGRDMIRRALYVQESGSSSWLWVHCCKVRLGRGVYV